MNDRKVKIFLLYNPQGIIDKDIYLSAQNGRFQVVSREIKVTRNSEGHTLERLDLLDVAKTIISLKPDFVLTINGGGLDNDGLFAHFCASMQIPLIIWYVDEPFFVPEWGQKFFPQTTIVFTFDRYYEKRLREWGIPWVYTLPLGTNAERMLSYGLCEKENPAYSNNVSFVGTLDYEKIQYLLGNISHLWNSMPPRMVDVLDESIKQYRLNPKIETEEIVKQCTADLGVEFGFPNGIVRQMVLSFIDREASFRLRHETIEGLKPFGVSVYGESFWEKVVGKAFYKGQIDYYSDEIARLYRSSRINLNISKYQLKTTINQRVFDCPLCNGFLITDFKEDIEEYFQIDKDMVVFFGLEDLKKKVTHYLENQNKAEKFVENGKEAILGRHTYHHRIEEMSSRVDRIKTAGQFKRLCEKTVRENRPPKSGLFMEKLREENYL
jgi:spore maturation protein CgeB